MRAEKTPQGMKGIFASLNSEEVALYRITLDAQGKELSRERLPYAGGMTRIAPPPTRTLPVVARAAAERVAAVAPPLLDRRFPSRVPTPAIAPTIGTRSKSPSMPI